MEILEWGSSGALVDWIIRSVAWNGNETMLARFF